MTRPQGPLSPSHRTFVLPKGGSGVVHNKIKSWSRHPMRLAEEIPQLDPKTLAETLEMASHHGALEVVRSCLKYAPQWCTQAVCTKALLKACANGHIHIARLLVPKSDVMFSECEALRQAVENVHVDLVKLLLPLSDPKTHDSLCFRLACQYGHPELIELLAPLSDIGARQSEGLWQVIRLPDVSSASLINMLISKSDTLAVAAYIHERLDHASMERLLSHCPNSDFDHICHVFPEAHDPFHCPKAHVRWSARELAKEVGDLGKDQDRRKM